MTALLTATLETRMPAAAFVLVPAPLALGIPAEPCAPSRRGMSVDSRDGFKHRGGSEGGRFDRRDRGGSWAKVVKQAQLAGGGPLRG